MTDTESVEELLKTLQQVCKHHPKYAGYPAAIVKIDKQTLYLFENNQCTKKYSISTSRFGVGQEEGSNQTPVGVHCVQEKIGGKANPGEIFLSRQHTNKLAKIEHEAVCAEECITSRILWLSGLETGINKGYNDEGKCVDSYDRFIYIHGTHEEGLIGQPASIGCVRMKNNDVIDLFDRLEVSSLVIIEK